MTAAISAYLQEVRERLNKAEQSVGDVYRNTHSTTDAQCELLMTGPQDLKLLVECLGFALDALDEINSERKAFGASVPRAHNALARIAKLIAERVT